LQAGKIGLDCVEFFKPKGKHVMQISSVRRLMKVVVSLAVLTLWIVPLSAAQQQSTVVPTLVNFSGILTDVNGKPLTGTVGVTFSLHAESQGGSALWIETQNVHPDKNGHYSVTLGSTTSHGLPTNLFVSGEARWLAAQPQGQAEQPRVMLLAVPYALKSRDAETVGGLPPSAFALASSGTAATTADAGSNSATAHNISKGTAQAISGSGTLGYIPEWLGAASLGNSLLFQSTTGNLGISTAAPSQKFEIDLGNILTRGTDNFRKSGDSASFYLGDTNHLVQATFGGGLTLGAYKAPQALFVQDITGNVGIGSAAPAQKFEVDLGNLLAKGADNFRKSGDTASLYVGDTNHLVEAIYAGGLAMGAYEAPQALFIRDITGNVGIGTATPATTLEVNGTTQFDGLASFVNGQTVNGNVYITGALGIDTNSPAALLDAEAPGVTSGFGSPGLRGVGGTATGGGIGGGPGVVGYGGGGTGQFEYSDGPGGYFVGGSNAYSGDGIDAYAGSGWAGYFSGNLDVTGSISAGGKDFKIDHPLDPANKYLFHASVESSEMMDIYTGNTTTDAQGEATVRLPEWFETLNTDFRYQLTVIGQFAQAIVAREIQRNEFIIKTSVPNVKVSWQVTCVRQDAFARAHPLVVEQEKNANERGYYIHPELFGAPAEKQMEWARHPQLMKKKQAMTKAVTSAASAKPPQ
jgi:hypothetical protein